MLGLRAAEMSAIGAESASFVDQRSPVGSSICSGETVGTLVSSIMEGIESSDPEGGDRGEDGGEESGLALRKAHLPAPLACSWD